MSAQTIRTALGLLQDDPDLENAWNDLQDAVTSPDPGIDRAELSSLLEAARAAYERRREWEAVARLLELEAALAAGRPNEIAFVSELTRVYHDELFDDVSAEGAYKRMLALYPDDRDARDAVQRIADRREAWRAQVDGCERELRDTDEDMFRSSLLFSIAELKFRAGGSSVTGDEIASHLEEAVRCDASNLRASMLLERLYRREKRHDEVAQTAMRIAETSEHTKEERTAALIRAGRTALKRLGDRERARTAFEMVLDMSPANAEAMSFLSAYFSEKEDWDHLVALYEDQLKSGAVAPGQEVGTYLQIGMIHWRMRGKPESAEPWFDKVRKVEPAHAAMLSFFKEFCEAKGARNRLVTILTDAQRALPEGPERAGLAADVARLAEEDANAAKAIDQYKAVLRQDPTNVEARAALKRLYTQSESYNQLLDLLRQEADKTPAEDKDGKLRVLREIARIYKQHVKNDTALVTTLSQIVNLDDNNEQAVRDLVRVYEALSRWRDLLTFQQKLADMITDTGERVALYRAVARRWLEQFSNVGNGVDAYEALLKVAPRDEEARSKLRELYTKRRNWAQLFALSEREVDFIEGRAKVELIVEMAKLAAERLDKGADAIRLYKEALLIDESAPGVLDALEKQAEREKDFGTVAEVLERRVDAAADDASRLNLLQKLGSVYADRLTDPVGAARAWRRVLALQPGHAKALRVLRDSYLASGDLESLEELYASQGDWDGLAEVLSGAADKTQDPDLKVKFSLRTAKVFEERLNQPERAFRSYERILSVRPDDELSARALVPIFEREERWARLPSLYEILLGHATDNGEKIALLRKLAQVTGQRLGEKPAAVAHARRAYELDPAGEGALEFLEGCVRDAGAWGQLTEALLWRLQHGADLTDEGRRSLKGKVAEVYASQLGKVDEAVSIYRVLVEEEPSDREIINTLDGILRSAGRKDDLRWLFELRANNEPDESKVKLFDEWATLEEEVFGEPARSIELYRRVLTIAPEDGTALAALSRLLLASGDAQAAAAIVERRRDLSEGLERANREIELASLLSGPLSRPADALAAAVRALALAPTEPRAIALLEKLLEVPETRPQAAEVLQEQYEQTGDAKKEAGALQVMLDGATDAGQRLSLYSKLADVHERKLNDPPSALDVVLRALVEYPTELVLWDRASDLASAANRWGDLATAIQSALGRELPEVVSVELCERAAAVHDERLGDPQSAIPFLNQVLERQPTNDRAFQRLKQILTSTEKWLDLEALYERVVAAAPDPGRKVELLAEVALVCESVTNENAKAIAYYERILEIDGLHEQSLRSLDALYQAEKRPRQLSQLLTRRLSTATQSETVEIKLRLGKIHLTELDEPEVALGHLEEVLRLDVSSALARELIERIIGVPELKARAAEVLEQAYEALDDAGNLVRVLEIRLEGAGTDELRRELLRRIADLRDQKLNDDRGSLEALARLVPLDPADSQARARLQEVGRRLDVHLRVANVLLQAVEGADSKERKAEILMDVARIHEDFIGDKPRAEEIYRRVVELDPNDPTLVLPAAKALERLYEASGNPKALSEILALEVKLETATEARRDLWARLGELYESVLDDLPAAINAWKARLEDEPTDDEALSALERLYEKTGAHRDLVTTLRAREQAAASPDERRRLMVKAAETLSSKLEDVAEAIRAWRAVVDDFGPDRATLAALASLYEKAGEWVELSSILESDLQLADEPDARLTLFSRLGDVRRMHLSDLPGALEAYRQALQLNPSHGPSRLALEMLLEVPDARREAAETLHPLYEADGDFEMLLRVLDIEVETSDVPSERLEKLDVAVRTAEGPLSDPKRAFDYATRALKEAAGDDSLGRWLERIEALTALTGRFAELVTVLSAVSTEVIDGDMQLAMRIRIAEIARSNLGDKALARDWYKQALTLRPDDRKALIALESLYEEMGDAAALLEILKRRVEVAPDDDERRGLLYRQAKLSREILPERSEAIRVYEAILELGLDEPAVLNLEILYAEESRFDELVSLYERQIAEGAGAKADLHVKLATVAEKNLSDIPRAFEELEAALNENPTHQGAIEALERLLTSAPELEHRARAGEMLEPVYLRRSDWKAVMKAVEARLSASQEPDERRSLLKRLTQLHEEQEENFKDALETAAKLLHEDLSDESTWAELERLARLAGADARLAEIYAGELSSVVTEEPHTAKLARRTGELFSQLKDVDRALQFYRRALAFEPESRDLFAAVDTLLVNAGRAGERVDLYRAALDHRSEPADRLAMLHIIADLEENALSEPEKAIDTYRAALDVDERDARSLDALTRLYRARKRHRDLSELFARRADLETDGELSAGYRLELSRLLKTELDDVSAAIDQLESIVNQLPWHREAIADLEKLAEHPDHKARVLDILQPLYQRANDWKDLIRLNEQRLSLAADPGEKIAIYRNSAELFEQRASDYRLAFDAIRKAFAIDPEHQETRADLDRLAEQLKAWDELADSYEQAIAEADDHVKRDLLLALAKVHDVRRDDLRRALNAYDRLFALDETDVEPLNAMDDLALMLADWTMLVRVLNKKAELVPGDDERAALHRRVGGARRDMMDDADGAIAAYERALELEPSSIFTVDSLIDLHEQKNDAQRLVELYRRRVELADPAENDLRYQLLCRMAERYEKSLNNRAESIEALREALGAQPSDRNVLAWLDRLYRAEERWDDLLENLRLQAGCAESAGERNDRRRAMGDLYREKLDNPLEALECYRLVLDEMPSDDAAINAVRSIGEAREELRASAADILDPVLRTAGRWTDLVGVLELRLKAQGDTSSRATTLRTMAIVQEMNLASTTGAEEALLRALAETPDDEELHAEIERLALMGNGFARYADALAERAQSVADATVGASLHTRLGRIAEDKLKDDARAISAFKAAVDQGGDTPELLSSLDRLYTRSGDAKALADVLERRVSVEQDTALRAELHFRLATLQISKFNEPRTALATLRQALDIKQDHEGSREALESLLDNNDLFADVAETLETVYRALDDYTRLARLLERRVAHAPSERDRIRMRLDLAHVLEEQAKDAKAAQRVIEAALADDPSDPDLLAEIDRLTPITTEFASAAAALDKAITGKTDLGAETARDLYVKLAELYRDRLGDRSAAESAYERALSKDAESLEIIKSLEELRRAPGRERDLVGTLRKRAKLETDIEQKRTLLREAKALADSPVGDAALAEEVLRQLLEENDADLWAIEQLTSLREKASDWKEATKLLLKAAELVADGAQIAELRHRAAAMMSEKLDDVSGATKIYEELFENDPADNKASVALRALYEKANRTSELSRLLERLIDVATAPSDRTALRIELARLQAGKLKADRDAIETLRAVLDEEPGNATAVVDLSQLYEKAGKDDDLAELLNSQIELAKERGDVANELTFKVRLGEIYEKRLKDATRAIETFTAVLEREPKHKGALYAVARLHEGKNALDASAQALEKLLDIESGQEAIDVALRLAGLYGKQKNDDGARKALERALALDPKNADVRGKLRALYERQKEWGQLAEIIAGDADAASTPVEQVKLYRQAADIHRDKRSDVAAAANLLEKASALAPDDRELLLVLCDAYSSSGRGKDSIRVLEKIRESYAGKRSKELATIHQRLAQAFLSEGDKARALTELDAAFKIDPGAVATLRDLGLLTLEMNDLDRAQKTFRALLLQKLEPPAPITKAEVFYYLGEISHRQGDKAKAIQMLERSVENDANLAKAKELLAQLKG